MELYPGAFSGSGHGEAVLADFNGWRRGGGEGGTSRRVLNGVCLENQALLYLLDIWPNILSWVFALEG